MKGHAFIFARGGSKGLPGKNIMKIQGVPLLAYSIKTANSIKQIQKCFVSTDSPEIAEVANDYGAIVIDRPSKLSTDESPEWLAWQHAINWVKNNYGAFELFISLPTTSPLRLPEDVQKCISKLDNKTDIVLTMTDSHRSPWFNMVYQDDDEKLELILKKKNNLIRRQDAPIAFDLTTVAYVSRPNFVLQNSSIWDGRSKGVVIPPERAIDIDTRLDFMIASFLIEERERAYVGK